MKLFSIFIIFFFLVLKSYSQTKILDRLKLGKYNTGNDSHANPFHYEEITLHGNGEFDYFVQMNEFVQLKKNGKWTILKDTLILNEDNPKYKKIMTVEENVDKDVPNGFVRFNVLLYDNNEFRHQISVIHLDTTVTISNLEKPSLINLTSADSFVISGAGYEYPSYKVKNNKANYFLINVSPSFSFVDEKWLIIKGKIQPKGSNGLNAGYFLELTKLLH